MILSRHLVVTECVMNVLLKGERIIGMFSKVTIIRVWISKVTIIRVWIKVRKSKSIKQY